MVISARLLFLDLVQPIWNFAHSSGWSSVSVSEAAPRLKAGGFAGFVDFSAGVFGFGRGRISVGFGSGGEKSGFGCGGVQSVVFR